MATKTLTLCIVHQGSKVLLGMKKRGFGEGKWNGFGGKVHDGETIEEASWREMQEEANITPSHQVKLGVLEFTLTTLDDVLQVHIFKCTDFVGEVGESEEMKPQWFAIDSIPFSQMWESDIFWYTHFLNDQKFTGHFHFDDQDHILEHKLREVGEL